MFKIPVLLGPTSSGKTSLAVELCKKYDAAIISADSRQIYKFMDIGTGKIPVNTDVKVTKKDGVWYLDSVAVYGYDLATPDQNFSGYDFAKYALATMEKLKSENKKFIIVGGTGFYVDLLTARRELDSAAPDLKLREELEKEDLEDLLSRLEELDPIEFDKIDKNNKVRVLRAVEKNLSQNTNEPLKYLENVEYVFFGLDAEREYLYARVDKWMQDVWDNGLLEETKYLLKKFPNSLKLHGLVYKSVISFFQSELNEPDAIQRAKFDLHAYIRRQLTWFRKNSSINWLNIDGISREQCIIKIGELWTKTS
jgi:tRNA dimethylallyltransferase